jgi:Uma2 family endonuclease
MAQTVHGARILAHAPLFSPRRVLDTMAMPHPEKVWTLEMVHALPDDGQRYEIIDGELYVTPAPSLMHQYAAAELWMRLGQYLNSTRAGWAAMSPADVTFSATSSVQPDVFVMPLVEGRAPRTWDEAGRILLAIEVRGPSTAARDVGVKRRLYQRYRVPEYWSVDCDGALIERWRPDDERPEVLTDRIEWQPAGAEEALVLELPAFFAGLGRY